ncbi:MAG: hypothetical protein IID45_01140 [Planctomycetes bacterium]|nr:hypothetical protein [Planctomycetota bacterium]
MNGRSKSSATNLHFSNFDADETVREILGYLNYSNGRADAGFRRSWNRLFGSLPGPQRLAAVRDVLFRRMNDWKRDSTAFGDTTQAEAILSLVVDVVLPAYRRHHADLLFHLDAEDFEQPFLLAKMCEATLEQGPPWDESERIAVGAVERLNDFIGYRPLAVLENDRKMQPYEHERCLPVPLYIDGVGVACGRYHDLVQHTVDFFQQIPEEIQRQAHFEFSRMEELTVDVRAYDHLHPANKRTNYMFGEWDPHVIDGKGFYRRFVVRQVILESLLSWMAQYDGVSEEERLHDAAAVLCGTMLMASAISGSGPGAHDSTTSLSSLLPSVAQQRDLFYAHLLSNASGKRARRLQREAEATQQPFGHVRIHLNLELARLGARQVNDRFLAQLYARMGSAESSRQQAARIPSPAARFESEIAWRLASCSRHLDREELDEAVPFLREIGDLLDRGIECGALVDPWNILAFQALYPLFQSREDSIPDQRIEILIEFMEWLFDVYSRAMSEAAVRGDSQLTQELSQQFQDRAEWWDRFAATVVEDLPKVHGVETWKSACSASDALSQWRRAGEAAGDISFWRNHVDRFQSPTAYGQVVETLLDNGDRVASMGLMMQWLSQAGEVGLVAGAYSFHTLILRWMDLLFSTRPPGSSLSTSEQWTSLKRLFDYLEANAGAFWSVPGFDPEKGADSLQNADEGLVGSGFEEDDFGDDDEDDEESALFSAAYDGVVFRDSADDGHVGDTLDDGFTAHNSEIEAIARRVDPRLDFLNTLAELWSHAGLRILSRSQRASRSGLSPRGLHADGSGRAEMQQTIESWLDRLHTLELGLGSLLMSVTDFEITLPSGDADSNFEYDLQVQSRHFLQHRVVDTLLALRQAGWRLQAGLETALPKRKKSAARLQVAGMLTPVYRADVLGIRRRLPDFLKWLAKQPLLYVSLENNGDPKRFLSIRTTQTVLKVLLRELARLGMLDEVWQLLQVARQMEKNSRPTGMATTEFDQLFQIGLKNSLECIVRSFQQTLRSDSTPCGLGEKRRPAARGRRSVGRPHRTLGNPSRNRRRRRDGRIRRRSYSPGHDSVLKTASVTRQTAEDEELLNAAKGNVLIAVVNRVVEHYWKMWKSYSRTIRISAVEALETEAVWDEIKSFIEKYGADFFQTPMLMISNVRSILSTGIDGFLNYLAENDDPLHPNRLIQALECGEIDREDACHYLELAYECLLDKRDRFFEYNTTSTQSDYGELFYCLLDLLRVEAAYDRDNWILKPFRFAHQVLTRNGSRSEAALWEDLLEENSQKKAARHLRKLQKLEKQYGIRLPSLTDRLQERFVKTLAVNRMTALVPRAFSELQQSPDSSTAFDALRREIDAYLASMSGSAIEIPDWLMQLGSELERYEKKSSPALTGDEAAESEQATVILRPRQLARRLLPWMQKPRS